MPKEKDFKRLVRARMTKTGASYTAARSQLRPREIPDPKPGGKNAETAAAARLLAHLGVRAPHTREPFTEEMLFGVGGGIGVAYFVFEYKDFTSFYIGGQINPFVQKADFLESIFKRLGVPYKASQTTSESAAEKQLRAVLEAGDLALVVVDKVEIAFYGLPREFSGMVPHTVAVKLEGTEPVVFDLAPDPFSISWKDLARARGRIRSAKNRMLAAEAPRAPIDLARAVTEGIRETCRGMLRPPMTNFGITALEKWAALLTNKKDKKGWPTVFAGPRLYEALRWLVHWVENSGTGGGAFRRMYAGFLAEAAEVLGRRELAELAARYGRIADEWTALARAALPDSAPPLGRIRELMAEKERLIEREGAAAADRLERIREERRPLDDEVKRAFPLAAAQAEALLSDLRERVLRLYTGEREAVEALSAAVS